MKRMSEPSGVEFPKRIKEENISDYGAGEGTSRVNFRTQESEDSTETAHLRDSILAGPLDPADWPELNEEVRMELVSRGPFRINPEFVFPKKMEDGRSCHHHHFFKRLPNGEKIRRSWVTYSKKKNTLFCFCCKLFSTRTFKLIREGLHDWKNCSEVLKSHENSPEHAKHMSQWKDMELKLGQGQTMDDAEMSVIEAERKRWRDVLTRLVAIIQSLAERNLTLRGGVETLYHPNNGNFLKEIELMAQFDPVLMDHIVKVEAGEIVTSYLGKNIQNELIDCVGQKIVESMIHEIKQSKYFSIILDCTPDLSSKEKLSLIIRLVAIEDTPEIKEHFMGFLETDESTEENLSTLILKRLEELDIPFEDCRGQFYDNGANMKGKERGVQTKLLDMNPRALFVPCAAHTVNLAVADAAKSSTDAIYYFGYVQKLFTLFSASPQRWSILRKHVNLKAWTDARWESRLHSVAAVRYQAGEIRDALLEVRDNTRDPILRIDAQSLAEELGSYRFSLCTVVWHDILTKIRHVNLLFQLETMQVDAAVDLLKKTEACLVSYRDGGFASAQEAAEERCEEMNTEPVLQQKKLRNTEKHYAYEAPDEELNDALERMEASFFNVVVDETIATMQERSQSLDEVGKKFSVLVNFPDLPLDELKKQCDALSDVLSFNGQSDLDGTELSHELHAFPDLPKHTMTSLELLRFLHETNLKEVFPNTWDALRIAVTVPVTGSSAERSLSKLKLKNFLKSYMSQERLNGLALISINRDVSKQVSIDDTIDVFAAKKPRRVQL